MFMRKKIILWLSFMAVLSFALQSCIHDELNSSSDPFSKEYHSKSLWKEDEVYIKNVMQVYFEHENEIKKGNGVPLWDYAMTLGNLDESFLIVPVANGNTVVSYLQVPRNGGSITFTYKNDQEHIKFFQGYTTAEQRKPLKSEKLTMQSAGRGLATCSFTSMSMWYPTGAGLGYWETSYVVTCPPGDGGGGDSGGGGDPTYPYPGGGGSQPPEQPQQNPCAKLKAQTTNATFKSNITNLQGKTGDNYESGFRMGTGPGGIIQNQMLQNKPGTNRVDLKAFSNTVTLMHSHYDGLYPMFSPGDIIFFNQWIVWAQNWNSIATNTPKIPLNNLTFTLVTSNGNYSFNFDGTSTIPFPNYTLQQLEALNNTYKYDYLNNAVTVGNISGEASYDMAKLEKEFLKFMNDKMNMDGLKLYKTTENGNTQINLVNGSRETVPCPN